MNLQPGSFRAWSQEVFGGMSCCLCGEPLEEDEQVRTLLGYAHGSCAEDRWPINDSNDPGIPKPGM